MSKIMTFWRDSDGFSARDFLMVCFGGIYLLEQVLVFILAMMGKLPPNVLDVIRSLDTIVITIVGGTFGVQTVREFTRKKDQSKTGVENGVVYYEDQR